MQEFCLLYNRQIMLVSWRYTVRPYLFEKLLLRFILQQNGSGVAKGGHGRAFAQPSQTFAQLSQVASLKFTRGFTAAHKTTLLIL